MIRAVLIGLLLAGCAVSPGTDPQTRALAVVPNLPQMKTFDTARPEPARGANADIAADFLALHFMLENGRALPVFTRFETPITVAVTGTPPPTLGPDLARLLSRLRREAGIAITRVNGPAAVTIEAVSRDQIRRALPQAACFVVPNVSSLAQYDRDKRNPKFRWANLRTRTQMLIVLPNDASPQETRDCLHEELAQAIGPLNDLYHLPNSVFNDDNVHTVLTGFDMLILRTGYAPELSSGMDRATVAARLPGILARLNPAGRNKPARDVEPTPRDWITAVQTALGPGATPGQRRGAAARALDIATRAGWTDQRRAFSHYLTGRLLAQKDAARAQQHFAAATRYLDQTPGTALHRAYISAHTAAYALSRGDPARALDLLGPGLITAKRAENAALLATLMLLQSEALLQLGRIADARAVRLDSLGWARYGFGSDWAVQTRTVPPPNARSIGQT